MKNPFADPAGRHSAGRFGMALFLASLAVLFIATILVVLILRIDLTERGLWPTHLPPFPAWLALSTLILVASSGTMHQAVAGARAGRRDACRRALLITTSMGIAFLALQTLCAVIWFEVVTERWGESEQWRVALTGFYLLTGIHALHVIGGIAALLFTAHRVGAAAPDADVSHGVARCAMYWHFLDVVWLVLYALLLIGG